MTEADYIRRTKEADEDMLAFLRREQFFTVPDYLEVEEPEAFERPGGQKNFFQQAGDRDPRPLRAHNLPGHRLDSLMRSRDKRQVRNAKS